MGTVSEHRERQLQAEQTDDRWLALRFATTALWYARRAGEALEPGESAAAIDLLRQIFADHVAATIQSVLGNPESKQFARSCPDAARLIRQLRDLVE